MLRKRRSKIGTVKMTANSQLLTNTPKTKKKKERKLSKQLEQEQNHRNGAQQGSGRGRRGERYRE